MPTSPLDIVGGGIGGVFNYLGAKKQANAIKDAASTQAQSTREALDFTKGAYNDLQGRLSPYRSAGTTATNAMTALLGTSPYLAAARPPTATPPTAPPAMVTLRAPDGSTKQFASTDPLVAKARAAGAQVVG